ncbi:MAG TPA: GFA family protein [Steroidobacteraceae bacterium]|nr:GFA family protein [Steroidobacteraceae bacterium]
MSSPRQRHAGGCQCGAVRYQVAGPLRQVVACHCTQCRRITGHYLAATAARRSDFSLTSERALRWYDSSAGAQRGFCGECGATLFWQARGRDYISIAAGSLDDAAGLKIVCHIFCADKGAYYEIEPGARQIADGNFSVPIPEG